MANNAEFQVISESDIKRRKLRKGTHSCWECKRRKLRCLYDQKSTAICIGCRRRGTKCVSQVFPEEVSAPVEKAQRMQERVVRVETQLEQLIQKVGNGNDERPISSLGGIPTPASIDIEYLSGDKDRLYIERRDHESETVGPSKYESICRALYSSLPSLEDTQIISEARKNVSMFFHERDVLDDTLEQVCTGDSSSPSQLPAPISP